MIISYRARGLSRVPCPMSYVPCPMSCVPCPVSYVLCPVFHVHSPVSLSADVSQTLNKPPTGRHVCCPQPIGSLSPRVSQISSVKVGSVTTRPSNDTTRLRIVCTAAQTSLKVSSEVTAPPLVCPCVFTRGTSSLGERWNQDTGLGLLTRGRVLLSVGFGTCERDLTCSRVNDKEPRSLQCLFL